MMIMIAMRLKIIEDEAGDRLIMKIEDHLNEIISTLLLIFKLECKEAKKKEIYYQNVNILIQHISLICILRISAVIKYTAILAFGG